MPFPLGYHCNNTGNIFLKEIYKVIVFKGTNSWQTNSEYPDSDFLSGIEEIGEYWVIPDSSELALKIREADGFEEIIDENGNLTDIIPIPSSAPEQTAEERAEELKAQLDEIDWQAIRPLRAIAAGTATDEDREILTELERQAEEIRKELALVSQAEDGISDSNEIAGEENDG